MTHKITLIPGDGIGPEVTEAVLRILAAAGVSIEWERYQAGVLSFERTGQALPVELVDSVRRNKVALKGPVTTPIGTGFTSVNVGLRKALDLYANLRPVANLPGVSARFTDVDLVIVRENTEDLYAGLEHEVVPGVIESLKIITARASTRISEFAFQHARRHGRKKVTAIHKANIMKLSDGLFLDCAREVSRQYPDIQYDEKIVDACCMQLVLNPTVFDVLLLENLYGDIVSDLCAGLVGGLGVVGAANLGSEIARVRGGPRQRPRHCRQISGKPDGAPAVRDHDAAPHRRRRCGEPHHPRARATCSSKPESARATLAAPHRRSSTPTPSCRGLRPNGHLAQASGSRLLARKLHRCQSLEPKV